MEEMRRMAQNRIHAGNSSQGVGAHDKPFIFRWPPAHVPHGQPQPRGWHSRCTGRAGAGQWPGQAGGGGGARGGWCTAQGLDGMAHPTRPKISPQTCPETQRHGGHTIVLAVELNEDDVPNLDKLQTRNSGITALRPATVSLTASASFNGISNRQQPPPTALATSSNRLSNRFWGRL